MSEFVDKWEKMQYNVNSLKKKTVKKIKFNGFGFDVKLILKSFILYIVSPFFWFMSFYGRRTNMINEQNKLYEFLNENNSLNEYATD